MDKQHIVIGSRRSDLALWQTNHVIDLLKAAHPGLTAEVKIISTKGDEILDRSLPSIGGKGLFTEALEDELRSSDIDLAVHSLKDLPTEDASQLTVGAIPARAAVEDVLISRSGAQLDTLPNGATIGTSSRRRAAQLLAHRPDLNIIDIRGNVPTRINKTLDAAGAYDASLLAKAGVTRLSLSQHITQELPLEMMLPAPGQGALGIQCRDEATSLKILASLNHQETVLAVTAERAFLNALGGGCSVPVASYAKVNGNTMTIHCCVAAVDGKTLIQLSDTVTITTTDEAQQLGQDLAEQALAQGASAILEAVN